MTGYEPTADDAEHIERLQALRSMGTHNMFMELKDGLVTHFGDDGRETYHWVRDHFEYFRSSEWVDLDVEELRDA